MGKLDNRIALITGAASGIGRAIALKFAAEGALLSLIDTERPPLERLAEEILAAGGWALALACDVSQEAQVMQAVESTIKELGSLHILVNNAGISPMHALEEISLDEWNRVIAINLSGPFLFMKAALPHIQKAGNKGRIITMGSLSGQIGGIAVGLHYTASKGGIMAMTKQMAKLLAPYKATANNIAPGTTDTPLVQALPEITRENLLKLIPLGRLGLPEDVASVALFLASEEAQYITGATINVNGGMFIG